MQYQQGNPRHETGRARLRCIFSVEMECGCKKFFSPQALAFQDLSEGLAKLKAYRTAFSLAVFQPSAPQPTAIAPPNFVSTGEPLRPRLGHKYAWVNLLHAYGPIAAATLLVSKQRPPERQMSAILAAFQANCASLTAQMHASACLPTANACLALYDW